MESNLPEPKSHATVVPWRTRDEFINVYEKLYSTKLEDKRWAIDTIHIWESRCHAGLPTAIEATYCLVRAVIQDTLFNENLTFMIEKDLVSMYAVGLIRFVNLRTEHLQNASFKLRISDLAEKIDIPQWIVNLRHTATHSSFPPLDHLRFGAVKALKYLEDNFWKTDAGHMKQLRNLRTNFEQEVLELFDQYKTVQFQWIQNHDPEMSSKFGKDLKEITKK